MKIALVILNAEPTRGGAEKYTFELGRSLIARGHDVSLLATRFDRNVEPIRQVRLDGASGSRTGRYKVFCAALTEHLNTSKYDLVHAMLPVPNCDLYHPHAGIEAHNLEQGHLRHSGPIQQVISRFTNQLNLKRRLYADVERRCIEKDGARVLCLSRAMQQVAEEHYNLQEGQSFVLINGVDLERHDVSSRPHIRPELRARMGIGEKDVAALLMANNYRLKGLKQALAALQALGDPRAKLIVVGREPSDGYAQMARSMGIADRVIFGGPTTDAPAYYSACDLFVLPTAYDSCSLVVLEALAMGKPVITTRRNGAAEAMEDGVHGLVIDDQVDAEGLRESWSALLNDGLRAKMSAAALSLRPQLSKDRHLDGLIGIYAKIIQSRANV